MRDMSDYFGDELWPWITGMPNEMVIQIQQNVAKLMETLPETPEALEAAYQVASFNFKIAKAFTGQIGDTIDDDGEGSLMRVIAAITVQNVAVMLRIQEIREPT